MSEAPIIAEGRASSLGARLFAAFDEPSLPRFHDCPPQMQAVYERAAVSFVASLTYAESEGVREALLSSVLLEAGRAALVIFDSYGPDADHDDPPFVKARADLRAAIAQAEAVR